MSKIVTKLFALLAMVVLGATYVNADHLYVGPAEDGKGVTWYVTVAEDGKATLIWPYSGKVDGDYTIPSSVFRDDGTKKWEYPVAAIGEDALLNKKDLTSVTFPATIEKIGSYAFADCSSLTNATYLGDASAVDCDYTAFHSTPYEETFDFELVVEDGVLIGVVGKCPATVEIPSTVTLIGESAFDSDYNTTVSNITAVVVPSSVKEIGTWAFYECANLASVTLNDGLEFIGKGAFLGCPKLTSIAIPASVKAIDEKAFLECFALANVTLNDGLESIGSAAFSNCTALASVVIPASVKTIEGCAFEDCSSLSSVTFNEGLEFIGGTAFEGCMKLKSIIIPSSVKTIETAAFYGCIRADTLVLGDGLEYVGANAFYGCSLIKEVRIPGKVSVLGNAAFWGCAKLAKVEFADGIKEIGNYVFAATKVEGDVVVPASVATFNPNAFEAAGVVTAKVSQVSRNVVTAGEYFGGQVVVEYYGDEPSTFTGKFRANDGTDTIYTKKLYDGCYVGKGTLPVPARADFDFVGWNSAVDGSGAWIAADTIAKKDVTDFYAIWQKKNDEITLEKDAWSVANDGSYRSEKDGAYIEMTKGGRGVLTFDWRTEEILGEDGDYAELILFVDGNQVDGIVRNGEWTTVTLEISCDEGYDVTKARTFKWVSNNGVGYVKNIKWVEQPFTVTFDANGGTGFHKPLEFYYPYTPETITVTNGFVRTNHKLGYFESHFYLDDPEEYWWGYIVAVKNNPVKDADDKETGDWEQVFTIDFDKIAKYDAKLGYKPYYDLILSAGWVANTYTVTIMEDSVTKKGEWVASYDDEIVMPDSWIDGKIITKWNESKDKDGNVTYTVAGVEDNVIDVTFKPNGGKNPPEAMSFAWDSDKRSYGDAVVVTSKIDRVGYTLVGWEYDYNSADLAGNVIATKQLIPCKIVKKDGAFVGYEFTLSPNTNHYKDYMLSAVWVENVPFTLISTETSAEKSFEVRPEVTGMYYDIGAEKWVFNYNYGSSKLSVTNDVKFTRKGYKLAGWESARTAYGIPVADIYTPVEYAIGDRNGVGDGFFTVNAADFGTDAEGEVASGALYAVWTPRVYTATFYDDVREYDKDGKEWAAFEVAYGEPIVPPDSDFKGLTIKSWTPSIPEAMPDGDVKFWAKFATDSFNVSFDKNAEDATGEMKSLAFAYDEVKENYGDPIVVTNEIVREGYTLAGWKYSATFTMLDGSSVVREKYLPCTTIVKKDGTAFTYCTVDSDLGYYNDGLNTYTLTGDVKLVADWVENLVFKVDTNDGTDRILDVVLYYTSLLPDGTLYEDYLDSAFQPLEREGYTLLGYDYQRYDNKTGKYTDEWSLPDDPIWAVEFGLDDDDAIIEGTFTASWQINTHTVTFLDKDGKIYASWTQDFGTPMLAPEGEEGKKVKKFEPALPETMPDSDVTFTITEWSVNKFTVKFDLNGGEGKIDDVTFEWQNPTARYGESVEVSNTVKRVGYTFAGWIYDRAYFKADNTWDRTDTIFIPGYGVDSFKIGELDEDVGTRDVTLTAVWEKDAVITLDPNDGSEPMLVSVPYPYDYVVLTNDVLKAAGKSLVCWEYRPYWLAEGDPDEILYPQEIWSGTFLSDPYDRYVARTEHLEFTLDPWDFDSELADEFNMYYKPKDGTLKAVWNDNVVATLRDGDATENVELGWGFFEIGTDKYYWYQEKPVEVTFKKTGYAVNWFDYLEWDNYNYEYAETAVATFVDVDDLNKVWLASDMFGYDYDAWKFDELNVPINGELLAGWDVNKYTVTFKVVRNDKTEAKAYVLNYGEPIVAPDSWIKGYKFTGWEPALAETMPDDDVVYTADLTLNSFTMTLDANGGVADTTSLPFAYDAKKESYGAPAVVTNAAVREGYALDGWDYTYSYVDPNDYTNLDYTVKIQKIEGSVNTVTDVDKDGNLFTVTTFDPGNPPKLPVKDVTYTARWVPNFRFTLVDPENDSATPATVDLVWANGAYLPEEGVASPFEKEGYRVTEWTYTYLPEGAKEAKTVTPFKEIAKIASIDVNKVPIPDTNPIEYKTTEVTNYTYSFTLDMFKELYKNEDPLDELLVDGATLEAVWTPSRPKITFLDEDGKELASWYQDYGTAIVPPDSKREGFKVEKWNPELLSTTTMPNNDVTFQVVEWATNSFDVAFDSNGGDGVMDSVTFTWIDNVKQYGAAVEVTNKFTRAGYTLVGWDYTYQTYGKEKADGLFVEDRFIRYDMIIDSKAVSDWYTVSADLNNYKGVTLKARWIKDAEVKLVSGDAVVDTVYIPYPFAKMEIYNDALVADGKSVIYWTYTNNKREEEIEAGTYDGPEFLKLTPTVASMGNTERLAYQVNVYDLFGDSKEKMDAELWIGKDYRPYDGELVAVWSDNYTLQLVGNEDKTVLGSVSLGWYNKDGIVWYQTKKVASPFSVEGQYVTTWTDPTGGIGDIATAYDDKIGDYVAVFKADQFGTDAGVPNDGVLAAVWKKQACKVKFVYGPSYDKVYATWELDYGDTIALPDMKPDYPEIGTAWDAYRVEVVDGPVAEKATLSEVTYKINFVNNEFTVNFDANDGTGTMAPIAFAYDASQPAGQKFGEPVEFVNEFSRPGYTLVGWNFEIAYYDPQGTGKAPMVMNHYLPAADMEILDNGEVVTTTVIDPNAFEFAYAKDWYKDVTLVAVWKENIKFTFDFNDGTGDTKLIPVPITKGDIPYADSDFADDGRTVAYMTYRDETLKDIDADKKLLPAGSTPQEIFYNLNAWMFSAKYDYDVDPLPGTLVAHWNEDVVATVEANDGSDAVETLALGWTQAADSGFDWYQEKTIELPFAREGMTIESISYTKYRASAETIVPANFDPNGDGVIDPNDDGVKLVVEPDAMGVEHYFVTLKANMFGFYPTTKKPALGTVTVNWANKKSDITFDYNGGYDGDGKSTITYKGLEYGAKLASPDIQRPGGYTFVQWSPALPETVPGNNQTYTACWDRPDGKRYHVTFDANAEDATGAMDTMECFVDVPTPLFANGFERLGYKLIGWATVADAKKPEVADEGEIKFTAVDDPDVPLVLYAVWEKKVISVTFDLNGVKDDDGNASIVKKGAYLDAITAPDVAKYAPDGTGFGGWTPEFDGTIPADDVIYVAQWVPVKFSVSFDANGGEGSMADQDFDFGVEAALNASAFTRTGYKFLGWSLTKEDADAGNVDYTDGQLVSLIKGGTFYASWAIGFYKVTFDYNGGVDADGNTSLAKDLEFGTKIEIPAVTRADYNFYGWSPIVPETVPAGDVTYVAQWSKVISSGLWVTPYDQDFAVGEVVTLKLADVFEIDSEKSEVSSITIAGLPAGVKYTAATASFSGAPTKAGLYYVNCTVKNKDKYSYVATAVWNVGGAGTGDYDTLGIDARLTDLENLETGFECEISGLTMVKSVSGLPAGLKFSQKTGVISGAPTKAGKVVVKFTGENKMATQKTIIVRDSGMYAVSIVDNDVNKGTVSGAGVYAVGKKVSLRATAKNGWAFAGWYYDDAYTVLASRDASYPMILDVKDNVDLYAKYVTVAEDLASITLDVNGTPFNPTVPENWTVTAGVAVDWPVEQFAESATKVTVAGLPAGLKLVQDKVTKAYSVTGAPTTASKADAKTGILKASLVKFTVQSARNKVVYSVNVTVNPLPTWVAGTFDGEITKDGIAVDGLVQALTVATGGKVSGKILKDGQTWTLSAPWLDTYVEDNYATATVIAKNGKLAVTNEITIGYTTIDSTQAGVVIGAFGTDDEYGLAAQQNLWKTEPWKTAAKAFGNKAVDLPVDGGTLNLKVAASGAVTVAGNFTVAGKAYKATGTSVLIPLGSNEYFVYVNLPAKNSFGGFQAVVYLGWNGSAFEVR